MSDNITVTISGTTGTGKSAVLQVIREALAQHNFQLSLNLEGYDPQLDERNPRELRDVIAEMNKRKTEITIVELNLRTKR